MIMTPMTDIMVSAVAEEKTSGASANTAASASQGQRKRSRPLHDSRVPMRPVGRTIRTITSRR